MERFYIKTIIVLALIFSAISCGEDTIDLEGLGIIKGKVVKKGTNTPLANVKIATNPTSSTVFTNAEGFYKIENVPSGDYSLSAQREGLLAVFEGITVLTNKEIEVVFEMDVETSTNRPPSAPTLVKPEDNTTDLPPEIQLIWSAKDPDNDKLSYTITLRNEKNETVEIFENIADTTYTISGLLYGVKYFWQVKANDNINEQVYSNTFAFETGGIPNNRIVFSRMIEGNSVIYSADEQGKAETQLTSLAKNSFRPKRNVVNKKIAFLRSIGSQTHLFTMSEDGSEVKQITSDIGLSGFNLEEISFCWHDNGSKLLFPNQNKLYTINADGSGLSLVYQTSGDLITEVDKDEITGLIALKTNNLDGYSTRIYTIDAAGVEQHDVFSGTAGAVGSIDFSFDGKKILYTHDVSELEPPNYRRSDSHIFVYDFVSTSSTDLSTNKIAGTNDLDACFSPNNASVIFTNTSNDGISEKNIMIVPIADLDERTLIIKNASMPNWE